MQIYFHDRYIDDAQPLVSVHDRSFRFGDGVFETAIINKGKIWDWPAHEKRLVDGLKYFKLDIDIKDVANIAAELIAKNKIDQGYVRVVVSRGDMQGVGYKVDNPKPYLIVQTMSKPLAEYQSVKLFLSSVKNFYHYPAKTNNALTYTMALMEAEENGCENALILSADNYLAETATANIFWIKGDMLYTPSTDLPFVPGTVRNFVLKTWQGKKQEGKFTLDDLKEADEIFMTNVGGIITSVSEIKPLGIKPKLTQRTKFLREIVLDKIA